MHLSIKLRKLFYVLKVIGYDFSDILSNLLIKSFKKIKLVWAINGLATLKNRSSKPYIDAFLNLMKISVKMDHCSDPNFSQRGKFIKDEKLPLKNFSWNLTSKTIS